MKPEFNLERLFADVILVSLGVVVVSVALAITYRVLVWGIL